jgi:hypothetical protein
MRLIDPIIVVVVGDDADEDKDELDEISDVSDDDSESLPDFKSLTKLVSPDEDVVDDDDDDDNVLVNSVLDGDLIRLFKVEVSCKFILSSMFLKISIVVVVVVEE